MQSDTPPAADATPDNVATPGAGGAGDVDRLAELARKATPGPWTFGRKIKCDGDGCEHCWHTFDEQAEVFPPTGEAGPVATVSVADHDNHEYIAAANPAAVLALIAERDALRAEVEKMRWIPVGERLPDTDRDVLTLNDGGERWDGGQYPPYVEVANYVPDRRGTTILGVEKPFPWSSPSVTHWMELPEPPAALARVPAAEKAPAPAGQGDEGRE